LIVDGPRQATPAEIDRAADRLASRLLDSAADLAEARIALFIPPSLEFVAALVAVWRSGGVVVPLPIAAPAPELEYLIGDAGARTVLVAPGETPPAIEAAAAATGARVATVAVDDGGAGAVALPDLAPDRRALIVYTSGTTGRAKGVVSTHANVAAQIAMLLEAWEWRPADRTLLVLPLHHVHGLINVVGSAMRSGATLEILPKFDAETVWARLASGEITVFTAVPTIYHQLIQSWDAAPAAIRAARSAGCRSARLMMSGSAALPARVLERWKEISGHVLLERYGMTEIGMALANPLHGERRPGFVGTPLPTVAVRLVDERGEPVADGAPGELEVRGPAVFHEYWRRPDATREAFRDGWFRTGDIAVREAGAYRLLGRSSVDILKSGGHKISALEVEEVLREHPAIADCAVVGLDDEEWGQRVAAVIQVRTGLDCDLTELDPWLRERLAPHKVPRLIRRVTSLPRNAMGKVVKADVVAIVTRPD
jgi:malonyl-CoA/methylmalonyl-CoA synthetase